MLFRKVLYATDFSDVSANALHYVIKLKEAGCEEVVPVHIIDEHAANSIIERTSGITGDTGRYEDELRKKMYADAETRLSTIVSTLKEHGFKVSEHLIEGVPYQEIIRIADAEDVSLIVIGSHGRSNISRMLIGSVSENVIRHARQPVMVIRMA